MESQLDKRMSPTGWSHRADPKVARVPPTPRRERPEKYTEPRALLVSSVKKTLFDRGTRNNKQASCFSFPVSEHPPGRTIRVALGRLDSSQECTASACSAQRRAAALPCRRRSRGCTTTDLGAGPTSPTSDLISGNLLHLLPEPGLTGSLGRSAHQQELVFLVPLALPWPHFRPSLSMTRRLSRREAGISVQMLPGSVFLRAPNRVQEKRQPHTCSRRHCTLTGMHTPGRCAPTGGYTCAHMHTHKHIYTHNVLGGRHACTHPQFFRLPSPNQAWRVHTWFQPGTAHALRPLSSQPGPGGPHGNVPQAQKSPVFAAQGASGMTGPPSKL